MSGPKTSKYALTPEQRRILEEQRKLAQRRAAVNAGVSRAQRKIMALNGLYGREGKMPAGLGERADVSALMSRLDALVSSAAQQGRTDVAEATVKEMEMLLAEAEEIAGQIAAAAQESEQKNRAERERALDRGFGASIAGFEDPCAPLREEAARKLSSLPANALLPREIRIAAEEAAARIREIEKVEFLKNYIALSVDPLVKTAGKALEEAGACRAEHERLCVEYEALCGLYGYSAREFPCSSDALEELRAQIRRMQDEAARDDEQAYISACLDEVMAEMGYSVLGSREVTKRSGTRFRSELYSYAEGTAVNITYSSDGRIAMEIGGLDDRDREPSAAEGQQLCDSMERFCGDFRAIEQRLRGKGVVLADRLTMLPPERQYAQIINTADYKMTAGAQVFHAKNRRRRDNGRNALGKE